MKQKGFTLIELLAVIIIIAVIAIITVPTILGVIDKSRKAAYKDSIFGIMDSARIYLTMNQEKIKPGEEIEFVCNGISCSRETSGDKLEFKGEIPKSGSIYLYGDGNVLVESVYNGKYYANNETGEVVITEEDTTLTRGELTKRVLQLEKIVQEQANKINTLEGKDITLQDQISNLKDTTTSIDKVYPVGSIYISTSNVDPATLFKGTTWERYAEGRTLVGTSGTAGQTGGNSSITLAEGQLPSHKHTISHTHTTATKAINLTAQLSGSHSHRTIGYVFESGRQGILPALTVAFSHYFSFSSTDVVGGDAVPSGYTLDDGTGGHTHSVTGNVPSLNTNGISTTDSGNTGSGSAINIMNPYITVYMWKRIS